MGGHIEHRQSMAMWDRVMTMLSTMMGRSPHRTHVLPRPVLLTVDTAFDAGCDPAGSCTKRPQQPVGALAHTVRGCIGAHIGAHLMTIISRCLVARRPSRDADLPHDISSNHRSGGGAAAQSMVQPEVLHLAQHSARRRRSGVRFTLP